MPPKRARRGSGTGSSAKKVETILIDDDDWEVRPVDISWFEADREYEGRPNLFTIAMHYGGAFEKDYYVGGEVRFIDECNVNKFKLNDLLSMMVALGCGMSYVCAFFYALPENSAKCKGREVGHPHGIQTRKKREFTQRKRDRNNQMEKKMKDERCFM